MLLGFAIITQKPTEICQVSCKSQSHLARVSNDTSNLARVSDDIGNLARVSDDTGSLARVSDNINRPINL